MKDSGQIIKEVVLEEKLIIKGYILGIGHLTYNMDLEFLLLLIIVYIQVIGY